MVKIFWDKLEDSFSWEDSTNSFTQDGNAPKKEDEFIDNFRNYLLQEGVSENTLW